MKKGLVRKAGKSQTGKKSDKKGLSQVITVMLIILLSLVAIGVLWIVIASFISNQAELAQAESSFFSEQVDFVRVQPDAGNNLILSVNLRKSSGTLSVDSEEIQAPPVEVHVVSVADLSGSMRSCSGVSNSCCTNQLGGNTPGSTCFGISSYGVPLCGPTCGGILIDGLTPTQDANKQLVDTLFSRIIDNNEVGLSAYSGNIVSGYSTSLTGNNATLKNIINSWEAGGSTCICCGINDAKNKLLVSPSDILKTIIVMSDGVATVECSQQGSTPDLNGNGVLDDAGDDAIKAACDAYAQIPNLTIYSVGLGVGVDAVTMGMIAKNCGPGENYSAQDVGDLIGLYESLADTITSNYEVFNKFNYLKLVFFDSNGNQALIDADVPQPLETKGYTFDLTETGLVSPIVKIEVYPVIRTSGGREIVGSLFDEWELN